MSVRRIAGVGCAAALLCGCAGAPREPDSLRVLVYNIHAGKDASGADNLERVAALVKDTRADIALLQEVDVTTRRSGGVDQPARLRELTGLHVAFGRTLDFQGGQYGIAILSRWPIDSARVTPLPIDPPQLRSGVSYEPRGALRAFIRSPGGTIVALNTHLDASRDDSYRRQEARTVIAIADTLRARGLLLVGGDFNSEPGSAVQQTLTGSRLHDAWPLCGSGNGLTFPADSGTKRIDYLYLPDGVACARAEVIATRASDHRPLLVQVTRR